MDHGLRRARLAERLGLPQLEALMVRRLPHGRSRAGVKGWDAQLVIAGDAAAVLLTGGR